MTDSELDDRLHRLEAIVHATANGFSLNPARLRRAVANLPIIVEISLELTREVVRRVRRLESEKSFT